jgi:hypothetical protein
LSEFPNYFNYFTEIEEQFQRARGTSLFLLSPIDWALIESWKNSGVPLEAVLRGIDAAFEKWRGKRSKAQQVNSLAFCAQAVLTEAQRAPGPEVARGSESPFDQEEIRAFLWRNVEALRERNGFEDLAEMLAGIAGEAGADLEELERRLTVLEQKMIGLARASESEDDALIARRELETQLQPYRRKMTAAQLSMLESQFLERKLLERLKLPRLSLFYLR